MRNCNFWCCVIWWDRGQNSLKSFDLFIYIKNFSKIYFQYVTEACKYCTWTINKAIINCVSFLVYWVCNWCSDDRNRVILLKPWNSGDLIQRNTLSGLQEVSVLNGMNLEKMQTKQTVRNDEVSVKRGLIVVKLECKLWPSGLGPQRNVRVFFSLRAFDKSILILY